MGTKTEPDGDYYFNVRTRMVEHGRQSAWEHLMGPYETLDEAERALEIAQARNADWDEDDLEWDDEDEHPDTA
jgi:hypothetical protein